MHSSRAQCPNLVGGFPISCLESLEQLAEKHHKFPMHLFYTLLSPLCSTPPKYLNPSSSQIDE